MRTRSLNPFFTLSATLHILILFILMWSYEANNLPPVLENTHQTEQIIAASLVSEPLLKEEKIEEKTEEKKIENEPHEVIKAVPKTESVIPIKPLPVKKIVLDKKEKKIQPKIFQSKNLEKELAQELKALRKKAKQSALLAAEMKIKETRMQGEVDKFKALVLQAISTRWLVPIGANKNLSTVLLISLSPKGQVLDVQITKSSGNQALDRSARDAVFKASPLPVPTEIAAYEPFKRFQLKLKPMVLTELGA